MRSAVAVAALLVAGLQTPAAAGPIEDCNQSADLLAQVYGCTTLLEQDDVPDQTRAALLMNRCIARLRLGDPAQAATDCEDATIYAPEDPRLWITLGVVLQVNDRPSDALGAAETALALNPGSVRALAVRADARCALGEIDGAIDDRMAALAAGIGLPTRSVGTDRAAVTAWTRDGCPR